MTGASPPVWVRREGVVGALVLDCPELHNALDLAGIACLRACIADLARSEELRVVVVRGAGGGVFCAGMAFADIRRVDGSDNPFVHACDELEQLPVPTVCAVRRGAYGAGADLALACDFRIGTPDCRVRIPAAALGVHYDRSGLARATRRMGPQGAARLFLAAETLNAGTLLRLGFLDELIDDGAIVARVEERAAALAELAPLAVRGLKASLAEIAAGKGNDAVIGRRVAASWHTQDFREGVQARDEKRKPQFRGQ